MNGNLEDTNIEMPTLANAQPAVQGPIASPVVGQPVAQPVVTPQQVVQPQPVVAPAPAPVVGQPVAQPVVTPQPVVQPQPVVAPAPASVVAPAPVTNAVDQTVLNTAPAQEAAPAAPKKEGKKAELIGTVVFLTVISAIAVWWATSYLMLG